MCPAPTHSSSPSGSPASASSFSPWASSSTRTEPDDLRAVRQRVAAYRSTPSDLLAQSERDAVRLAEALADQHAAHGADNIRAALEATADQAEHTARLQVLVDVLLAEWHASNEYVRSEALHTRAKAWRARVAASVDVALAIARYRAEVPE